VDVVEQALHTRVSYTCLLLTSPSPSTVNPPMPVPWEALIPFGAASCVLARRGGACSPTTSALVTTMFGAAGTLLGASKRAQNQGKVRVGYWSYEL
jgi:hypothetical protein